MSDGTKGPVLIQGIKADDPSKPPVRMEIRDMVKNQPEQWNLYLLGLERFKNYQITNESQPLSYFQIAGIHGLPFTRWPDQGWNKGMEQVNEGDPGQWGGFCTHSSILFLAWHRPYIALFEAELYKHVNEIAQEFDDSEGKQAYIKAAKNFRMPYWDWALPPSADRGIFPAEAGFSAENKVKKPKGKGVQEVIQPNPLASYKFGESAKDRTINRFPNVGRTVRHPFNGKDTTDEDGMKSELTKFFEEKSDDFVQKGKNLTERVLFILQSYNSFKAASTNRFYAKSGQPTFNNWGSLEDIHNAIHAYTGGDGQMGDPSVAAFDPIFWLHHTNIDRLFAIWQACHNNPHDASTYVTPEAGRGGTFTIEAGSQETDSTPLTPFAQSGTKDKQTFWTSEGVRSTKTFGYVYPETQDWLFPTPEKVIGEIDRIYRSASLANIMKSTGADSEAPVAELKKRAESLVKVGPKSLSISPSIQKPIPANKEKAPKLPEGRKLDQLVENSKYLEWLVDIKAEKGELGGNYIVHVFLGDPDDSDSALYIANLSHVGAFATFGQNEDTPCKNCQKGRAEQLEITGQIPLTLALVERYLAGFVDSLTPAHVVPYLQKHLHWRVTSVSGVRHQRGELNNLLVSVVSNEVTIPSDPTAIPRYADNVVAHPDATTNRTGESRGSGTGYTGGNI